MAVKQKETAIVLLYLTIATRLGSTEEQKSRGECHGFNQGCFYYHTLPCASPAQPRVTTGVFNIRSCPWPLCKKSKTCTSGFTRRLVSEINYLCQDENKCSFRIWGPERVCPNYNYVHTIWSHVEYQCIRSDHSVSMVSPTEADPSLVTVYPGENETLILGNGTVTGDMVLPATPKPDTDNINVPAAVGGTLGVIALAAVVILLVLFWRRWRSRSKMQETAELKQNPKLSLSTAEADKSSSDGNIRKTANASTFTAERSNYYSTMDLDKKAKPVDITYHHLETGIEGGNSELAYDRVRRARSTDVINHTYDAVRPN